MSEAENRLSELEKITREETRERRIREIRYLAILLFIVFALALFAWGAYDYTYICRIRIPAGTTVVDRAIVRSHAGIFNVFFKYAMFKKLQPYLSYRHYIIPDGATAQSNSSSTSFRAVHPANAL